MIFNRIAGLAFTVLTMLAACPSAVAQDDQFLPRISSEMFHEWTRANFDPADERRTDLQRMHERMLQQYLDDSAEYRAEIERARAARRATERPSRVEEPPRAPRQRFRQELAYHWRQQRAQIELRFADEIRGVMRDDEALSWDDFIRDERRRVWFANFNSSSIRYIDVGAVAVLMFEQGDVPDDLSLLIVEYENTIDALLLAQEREHANGNFVGGSAVVAALNRTTATYFERLLDAMPQHLQPAFRDEVNIALFPEIYAQTAAHALIEELHAQKSISPEARAAVAAIEERFIADLAPVNERIAALLLRRYKFTDKQSEQAQREHGAWRRAPLEGSYSLRYTDVSKLWEQRFERILRTCRALQGLFPTDQIAEFPPHLQMLLLWHDID